MSDPYYNFYPGDYIRDTQDLSLTEHGAYRIMLDHYYCENELPSDKDRLYRICRAFSDLEKSAVDVISERFFSENGSGKLLNKRAEIEIEKRKEFIAEQSRKGKLSAEKRYGKANRGYNRGSTGVITGSLTEGQPKSNPPSPSLSKK